MLSGSDDIVVSAWSKFFTNSLRYVGELCCPWIRP